MHSDSGQHNFVGLNERFQVVSSMTEVMFSPKLHSSYDYSVIKHE